MKGQSHDAQQERSPAQRQEKQADQRHSSSLVVGVKIQYRPNPNLLGLTPAGERQEQPETGDQDRDTRENLCRTSSQVGDAREAAV